ncbi:cytochrome c [Stieleria sp. ICT_E10.1]|uniref:cytochrome c n=1 Tax=Stieleria sedimenti TaxID=2976331 RepID=UPI00218073A7|nr:cytochrome c [Stieleria sedimenti]MCS7469310.1 cytochrome c [Stieleria sedimenti]
MKNYILSALLLLPLAGCSRQPSEYTAEFEPNLVHAMKYQIKEGIPMEQAMKDASWIVDGMFGTPDEPTLPEALQDEDFADLISLDRIKNAAGPIAEGSGLYRKHCVTCHGVTGNGRGEASAAQDPYPRDYRHGIFKFKSTKRGSKPIREDLARSIRNGIAGTGMVKIPDLKEQDIQALVDYVIYLSIRGELERTLIDDAIFELDLEGGDRIIDRQLGETLAAGGREQIEKQIEAWEKAGEPEDDPTAALAERLENFDESMEIAVEMLEDIAFDWLDAEEDVVEVPEPPADIPVADNHAEFVKLSEGDQAETLAASIKRGQEIFTGKVASCSKCHGEKGYGDGQNKDYDDWTKDWTTRAGLKPEDTESLIPLMARGAMPPKNALPRNFSEGVFRGGEAAEDLYRRILQGIEGTPMPASTFVPGEYEKDDIWHLINFVRSVRKPEPETTEAI